MRRFQTITRIIGMGMALGLGSGTLPAPKDDPPKLNLSEYSFFTGNLADLHPAARVFPYEVNAPLFSDYAEKARFIFLPEGTKLAYNDSLAFRFPDGAAIIKTFYYPKDAARPEFGRRLLETRLLLKEPEGWKALEYIWNDTQTDATLEVAGATFPVGWRTAEGGIQNIRYIAPNLNQCKGCHSFDGQFVPIGITARQLNRSVNTENQLLDWKNKGLIDLSPGFNPDLAPRLTDYRHAADSLANRARAYLDSNCGHCHNPHGPASTSGMFLDISEKDPERLGIGKTPVAAGRGSGNRKFGIVPGKPGESILVFRMESDDPGIRMPELGRQLPHREGLELIKTWIKELK